MFGAQTSEQLFCVTEREMLHEPRQMSRDQESKMCRDEINNMFVHRSLR